MQEVTVERTHVWGVGNWGTKKYKKKQLRELFRKRRRKVNG